MGKKKVYRAVDAKPWIAYKFKCPYCERAWAFDNETKYCSAEFKTLAKGDAVQLECKCGESFIARGKKITSVEDVNDLVSC